MTKQKATSNAKTPRTASAVETTSCTTGHIVFFSLSNFATTRRRKFEGQVHISQLAHKLGEKCMWRDTYSDKGFVLAVKMVAERRNERQSKRRLRVMSANADRNSMARFGSDSCTPQGFPLGQSRRSLWVYSSVFQRHFSGGDEPHDLFAAAAAARSSHNVKATFLSLFPA